MDADEAIRSHREWKDRLRKAMATKEPMDIDELSSDKLCAFGRWLYSEASSGFLQKTDYSRCVALHAAFHLEAAKLASMVNDGRYLEADRLLALDTPYSEASQAFIISVRTLFASERSDGSLNQR